MEMTTHRALRALIPALLSLLLLACGPAAHNHRPEAEAASTPAQLERDEIYMLLAYAVVRKDWQSGAGAPPRGHNIGSVLVDPDGEVVFWARNANKVTGNASQHGEVRLIRNYLAEHEPSYLKGYTVYTTLEPCAMCSGMMVLTQVERAVYGQTDPAYGKALERLALDSHGLPDGFRPYPRPVRSERSDNPIRRALDRNYGDYLLGGGRGITRWLRSERAKAIYDKAFERFMEYEVDHPENRAVLEQARRYYREVVADRYVELPQ
jgi:tRNA(Arg) A34 adenosine deaminase TadA